MNVRLINAALDTFRQAPDKDDVLILRGVIDPASMEGICADSYQREILSGEKIASLKSAIINSTVPDIELGMRGDRTRCVGKGEYILLDPVYVIDGFQRISAARSILRDDPKAQPRIGATIHFNTTFAWEKERFRILNQARTKVSVNILLRNAQSDYKSIEMLAKLCKDEAFALRGRVQWQQRKQRNEVISALTLCRVAALLHRQFGASSSRNYEEIILSLERATEKITLKTMRENIRDFFDLLDECFGIRKLVFSESAVQVKDIFLAAFAELLSDFQNEFWDGDRLRIDRRMRLKLAKFPISDPEVMRLGSSGGKAGEILYTLLLDHIDKGKRSRRLRQESMDSADEAETATAGAAAGK